jgi:hypothetical protein
MSHCPWTAWQFQCWERISQWFSHQETWLFSYIVWTINFVQRTGMDIQGMKPCDIQLEHGQEWEKVRLRPKALQRSTVVKGDLHKGDCAEVDSCYLVFKPSSSSTPTSLHAPEKPTKMPSNSTQKCPSITGGCLKHWRNSSFFESLQRNLQQGRILIYTTKSQFLGCWKPTCGTISQLRMRWNRTLRKTFVKF